VPFGAFVVKAVLVSLLFIVVLRVLCVSAVSLAVTFSPSAFDFIGARRI